MRLIKLFFIILLIFNFSLLNAKASSLEDKISKNLRCLICQGQSVYDSDSEFATSLKLVVKNNYNGFKVPVKNSIDLARKLEILIQVLGSSVHGLVLGVVSYLNGMRTNKIIHQIILR